MGITFLSPLGAAVALLGLVSALALLHARRRGNRARLHAGLPLPPRRAVAAPLVAIGLAAGLLGLAAAQPVLEFTETRRVRTDAEVVVVLDTTRSMLARADAASPTRLARAKALAAELREALPGVRVGLSSLTDRALPHLFPTADEDVYLLTLERAIGIDRPPPSLSLLNRVTRLEALTSVPRAGFYFPEASRRLLVVLTDGETLPEPRSRLAVAFSEPPGVGAILVHVWGAGERVFVEGAPEPGYAPDPSARETLERVAADIGGEVLSEDQGDTLASSARRILGDGPTVEEGDRQWHVALAPYLVLASLVPVGFVLWRRDR